MRISDWSSDVCSSDLTAVARGQDDMAIAPRLDLREAFERRGRARQDHRQPLEMPAHHRDVARVIMDAVLLLDARLGRLVDDDDAPLRLGQGKRRPRTHKPETRPCGKEV